MAYRPRTKTTTNAAQELVSYDKDRTILTISNMSGETCYLGADRSVTVAGVDRGEPMFNNSQITINRTAGNDPRLERWIIGTVGGDVIIGEESFLDDLGGLIQETNRLLRHIAGK